jgi:aldehyde:ferredoxin oxidoreductase
MLPNEQSPPGMERFRRYVVSEGQHASDPRYGSMEDGSVLALGHLTDVHETDVVLAAVEKTYRYGLDAEPLGGTLAGAMECAERGLPMPWDGVLPPLTVGDGTQMLVAIDEIAARSGRGELLALGSAAAAAALGPRYEALAMSVKGKEVPPHDVRNKPGLALAMAVGSIGPDYALVEYDWDFSPGGFDYILDNSRAFGVASRTTERELGPAKVRQTIRLQRWWSAALECLPFDIYSIAPARYLPPQDVLDVVQAATGWDFSMHELLTVGERRIALLQVFDRPEGWTAACDSLPARFFDEEMVVPGGEAFVLDRADFMAARQLYYAMIGWDEQGTPTPAGLTLLDIEWAAEHLPAERP